MGQCSDCLPWTGCGVAVVPFGGPSALLLPRNRLLSIRLQMEKTWEGSVGVGRCPGATLLLVQARGLNVHSELCSCSARVFLESRGVEVSPSSWKQMEDFDFHQCRDCHTPLSRLCPLVHF